MQVNEAAEICSVNFFFAEKSSDWEAAVFGLDSWDSRRSKASDSTRKDQLTVDRKLVDQTGKALCRGRYRWSTSNSDRKQSKQ